VVFWSCKHSHAAEPEARRRREESHHEESEDRASRTLRHHLRREHVVCQRSWPGSLTPSRRKCSLVHCQAHFIPKQHLDTAPDSRQSGRGSLQSVELLMEERVA